MLLVLNIVIKTAVTDSRVSEEQLQVARLQRKQPSNASKAYCITEPVIDSSCSERGTCPPLFSCADTGKCKCRPNLNEGVNCSEKVMRSAVLICHCVTYDELDAKMHTGLCFYNCELAVFNNLKVLQSVYHQLPKNISDLNNFMCGKFNRDGVLCGECIKGLSPLVLSYNLSCIKCPNSRLNWLKFIAVGFIPLTIFYFVMVFFNINVTSSHMHGYVLFSQGVSTPALVRILFRNTEALPFLPKTIKFVEPFFSSWNLDFFRSTVPDICLNTDTL